MRAPMRSPTRAPRAGRGFTLVELLVAVLAMSILALMSWRGLDAMTRAQDATSRRADEVLTLQVALSQWSADLDQVQPGLQSPTLDWNGRVLRVVRRDTASATPAVVVAAWTRRALDGRFTWLRWQSPPITTQEQLTEAWERADIWSQNPGEADRQREVALVPLAQWQVFFHRGGAWTNPLSSDAPAATAPVGAASGPRTGATPPAGARMPDGVRLVLTLPEGQALSGVLTRDWVRPTLGGGKS